MRPIDPKVLQDLKAHLRRIIPPNVEHAAFHAQLLVQIASELVEEAGQQEMPAKIDVQIKELLAQAHKGRDAMAKIAQILIFVAWAWKEENGDAT